MDAVHVALIVGHQVSLAGHLSAPAPTRTNTGREDPRFADQASQPQPFSTRLCIQAKRPSTS
jgi:hypothetical protein